MSRNKLFVWSTSWVDVILFVIFYFIFWGRIRNSEDAMGGGGGGRSAPLGVLISPKRRVRGAHGRARVVKPNKL
jgi:hypothetical protein